ncbi:hypothetical protein AHMF7605_10425 [Adhaeribacter arboris]|uniref:PKD domain-containing protein n=1 Tax=Adhaeribacter arboris TaxID=2072846 RepID=A0A2T2YEH2_9BACT|nr:alginate lyase family protein [Adhaeribacter arboris]PSR53902.1 hypothetical protein AHMF7605_10425 [Adhaeribacter arboris]
MGVLQQSYRIRLASNTIARIIEAVANMTASPKSGNAPLVVAFDGTGSSGTNNADLKEYQWDFGDGVTATTTTPTTTHTYTVVATRKASLVVKDIYNIVSDPFYLTINVGGTQPPEEEYSTFTLDLADMALKYKRLKETTASPPTASYPEYVTALAALKARIGNNSPKVSTLSSNTLTRINYNLTLKPDTYNNSAINYGLSTTKRNAYTLPPYWWPRRVNTTTGTYDSSKSYNEAGAIVGNGEPYVKRDGIVNPETSIYKDAGYIQQIAADVLTLGVYFYYSSDQSYANKAVALLKSFFTSTTTGMMPHSKFIEVIKGNVDWKGYGSSSGFVATEVLTDIADSFQLLRIRGASALDDVFETAMLQWITDFWGYMTKEFTSKPATTDVENYIHWKKLWDPTSSSGIYYNYNNIRTLYTLQVCTFAVLTGKKQWAIDHINKYVKDVGSTKGLISRQFEVVTRTGTNGVSETFCDQPLELSRTRPWTYSCKNLTGWLQLCQLAQYLGMDLANYVSPGGSSIKKAINGMLFYTENTSVFPKLDNGKPISDPVLYDLFDSRARLASGLWPNDAALQTRIKNI